MMLSLSFLVMLVPVLLVSTVLGSRPGECKREKDAYFTRDCTVDEDCKDPDKKCCPTPFGGTVCRQPAQTCSKLDCGPNATCNHSSISSLPFCDDCNPNQCQNGGTCKDGVHSHTCTCPNGFTGDNCEINLDECNSTICQNGGTCTDGVNGYNCTCLAGFTGINCNDNKYEQCRPGNYLVLDDSWRDVNNNDVDLSNVRCDSHVLSPPPVWYRFMLNGQNAIIPTTPQPMEHCGTYGTMWLNLGGSTLPASGQSSAGRGCALRDNDICAMDIPGLVVFNCGHFFVYQLPNIPVCNLAYCAQLDVKEINECSSNPCQNNGTCIDGVNSYKCTCPEGFIGTTCDTNICRPENHRVLDDSWRDVNIVQDEDNLRCDEDVLPAPVWHRFMMNGQNAIIPTTPQLYGRCGTQGPMWLDLGGSTLPASRQSSVGRACVYENCLWDAPGLVVFNCGPFFVYQLPPLTLCYTAYCAQLEVKG